VPKYIFRHMIKTLRESQTIKRCWIPYGRLVSEILHQGGILNTLKEINLFTDAHLGTVTGKVINGSTLKHMKLIKKEDYTELSIYLKESAVVSNLMDDFPPICKQDPLDVKVNFIMDHYEKTGQTIKRSDIPDTMYGGALPIAKSRKSKKRAISKTEYIEEAPEPLPKKAKKAKAATQVEATGYETPQPQLALSIPKKKRKHHARKLKESLSVIEQENHIVAVTGLVTREIRRKKAAEEAALQKALEIATEIEIPAEALLKKSTI